MKQQGEGHFKRCGEKQTKHDLIDIGSLTLKPNIH